MNVADQSVLDRLSRDLDEIEKNVPMLDGYERTDLEVIDHEQADHTFRFITFHKESRAWWKAGTQEWSLQRLRATSFVKPDDVVFDIGCNAGFLTVWFGKEVPEGKVLAFDPYPWNAAATRAQAALNGLTNVHAYAVGIGPRRASLTVPATSSKTFKHERSRGRKLRLRIEPLSAFAAERPTFAKIDIEGAEHQLGRSVLKSTIERGYVEMHPQFIRPHDPARFIEELRSGGFRLSLGGPDEAAIQRKPEVEASAYYFSRERPTPWWVF